MKSIEDHIKKRLQQTTSKEGIDSDQLWTDIAAQLPNEDPSKGFLPFRSWWALVVVVFFLLTGIIGLSLYRSGDHSPTPDLVYKSTTKPPSGDTHQTTANQLSTTESAATLPSFAEDAPSPAHFDQTSQTVQEFPLDRLDPLGNLETEKPFLVDPTAERFISLLPLWETGPGDTLQTNGLQEDFPGVLSEKQQDESDPLQAASPPSTTWQGAYLLPSIGIEPIAVQPMNPDHLLDRKLIEIPVLQQRQPEISVSSGWNIQQNLYRGGQAAYREALQSSNSLTIGRAHDFHIRMPIKGPWSWSTGLGLVQTKSEFNQIQQWDTLVLRDGIPGGELLPAQATRTVRHFNRQSFISVPIGLDYASDRRRWGWGFGSSLQLNWMYQQSGRTLTLDEAIVSYPNAELAGQVYRSFFVSAQLRPRISYRLNRQFSLEGYSDLRFQFHRRSSFHDLTVQSVYVGWGLGLTYRLD